MRVNQAGHPIEETQLFAYPGDDSPVPDQEIRESIRLLCEHLGVELWRTNKGYGSPEIELRRTA